MIFFLNLQPNKSKNILELSSAEKKQFWQSFDNIFSDIDGVLWSVEAGIPGAPEGFHAIMSTGKDVKFITNNSVRPVPEYAQKFEELKIALDTVSLKNLNFILFQTKYNWNVFENFKEHLVHPAQSVVDYLKSINFEGSIYALTTKPFKELLTKAGFELHDPVS